jgi:FlaA1/EpsC-like NDP-sugar epimerase
MAEFVARRLPFVHFALDALMFVVAVPAAAYVRYDFSFSHVGWALLPAIGSAIVLQALFGVLYGQYRRKWQYGSFDEVLYIGAAAISVGLALSLMVAFWWETAIPRSVPMMAALISLLGQVAVRSAWRAYVQTKRRHEGELGERLIVIGAGEVGAGVARLLLHGKDASLQPVAFLDDDTTKRNLRIAGVPVLGTIADLADVAEQVGAEAVLVAMPSVDGQVIREIDARARELELNVLVTPPVDQLFGGVGLADIRPISYDDLLGRRVAEIDPVAIAGYVRDRRVLITGAGGSIGGELCRQIKRFEPSQLLMLDRDESGLHGTQLSVEGRALLDSPDLILADIRDADRVDAIMAEYRPEIVFHAAALKHLPLLESHPEEGWKTNVLGTLNLLESAARHGREPDRFGQ